MKTFTPRKGLVIAQEGLDEEATPVFVDQETNFLYQAEQPLLEMTDTSVELAAQNKDVEEAVLTIGVMDEINVALAETIAQDGGMSQPVADALRVAVEHFSNRLGFSSQAKLFPAMEAFGSTDSRKLASTVAMEGIADTIKRIWGAILAAFERMVAWVASFFDNHAIAARRLINRSVNLKKRIDAMGKNDDVAEGSVADRHTRFVKHLKKDGESLAPTAFIKGFEAYVKEEHAELQVMEKGLSSLAHLPTLLKTTIGKGFSQAEMNEFMLEIIEEIASVMQASTSNYSESKNKDIRIPERCDLIEKKMPFGDTSKYAILPDFSGKGDVKEMRVGMHRLKFFNAPSTGSQERAFDESKEVHVDGLTLKEAHAVASLIESHLAVYASINKSSSAIKTAGKYFKEMADYASSLDPKYTGTGKAQLAACVARVITVFTSEFIKNSLMYDVTLCNAALEYCAISIRKAG